MTIDEMISILETTTRYSYDYLRGLTTEQLTKLYEERTNGR